MNGQAKTRRRAVGAPNRSGACVAFIDCVMRLEYRRTRLIGAAPRNT